jgi:hypothetical protein
MAPKLKKIILLGIIGIAAIGGAIAYYLYNKGPVDVKSASGIKCTATSLYQVYSKDSLQAKKQYTDKILSVTGIVNQVSQNQQNQAVVLLKTDESGAYINCTMEGVAQSIKEKDAVIIKGICTGIGAGDADMGILGDVYLLRCYQEK